MPTTKTTTAAKRAVKKTTRKTTTRKTAPRSTVKSAASEAVTTEKRLAAHATTPCERLHMATPNESYWEADATPDRMRRLLGLSKQQGETLVIMPVRVVAAALLLVLAIIVIIYMYSVQQAGGFAAIHQLAGPDVVLTSDDHAQILAYVTSVMDLPDTEPTVLAIDDATQLAGEQAFFAETQDGDVLFLYPETAVIFRPKTKKIVQVGPVVIQN